MENRTNSNLYKLDAFATVRNSHGEVNSWWIWRKKRLHCKPSPLFGTIWIPAEMLQCMKQIYITDLLQYIVDNTNYSPSLCLIALKTCWKGMGIRRSGRIRHWTIPPIAQQLPSTTPYYTLCHCQMHRILLALWNQNTKGSSRFHSIDCRSKPYVQPPAHPQIVTRQSNDCWNKEITHREVFNLRS